MDMRRPTTTLTIDLGDVSVPEVVEGPGPVAPSTLRTIRTLAVLILIALLTIGATPGMAHLDAPIWTGRASLAGFTMDSQGLTLSDPGTNAVLGRDLRTGERVWRVLVPDPPQYNYSLGNGLRAVVIRDPDAYALPNADPTAVVVEPTVTLLVSAAGNILARVAGNQVGPVAQTYPLVVATGQSTTGVGCPDDVPTCTDVSAFDVARQRQVWRLSLPGSMVPAIAGPDAALSLFATSRPGGRVEIRDPATGAALRAVDLPASASSAQLLLVGDTLVSAVRADSRAEVTAYPVGPRGRTWTAAIPVSPTVGPLTARFYLAGCGRLVCLHADGEDALIDPVTGVVRGQVNLQVVGQVGDILLAIPSTEVPGTVRQRRIVYLLDAANGQRMRTLLDTAVVAWYESSARMLLARQGSAGTDFSILDERGLGQPFGAVSGVDLTCAASDTILLCADPVGFLRAWHIPTTAEAVRVG